MENKNEFQELLDKMLKEQEEKLTKQFKEREQQIFSSFDDQLKVVVDAVANHIGKEVVSSFADKFGVDAEATKHAQQFPYHEQSQVALHLLREDGQLMTADEFAAKHSTKSMDEFNYMGGLTTTIEQAEVFDPFKNQLAGPTAELDQDTRDIMTAIDYQVQNYTLEATEKDAEPAIAQEVKVSPFSKDRTQAAIKGMRAVPTEATTETPTPPGQAPVEALSQDDLKAQAKAEFRAARQAIMTKQDTDTMPTITPEMAAAAMESSQFVADAHFITKNQGFATVLEYRTMSPKDPALSPDALATEMSEEKFKVGGLTNKLVNYFDKVRNFAFAGKTAEEHREKAIEKNDVQEWLNSFQPARQQMKESHESELKLMPFDASDRDIEQMKLKHQVEQKFFDYNEKKELASAHQYFKNEKLESLPNIGYPTATEKAELEIAFKDYAAHRLGKTWKHTYASPEQDPDNPKQVSKGSLITAMKRNQDRVNIAVKGDVQKNIKSMRMSM